jgi:hypothetical protein
MTRFDFLSGLLRNADGGGASGAGAAAGGDQNAGAGGALAARAAELAGKAGGGAAGAGADDKGAGGQGAGGAPQLYFPKDLPEQFKGATNNETIDKLYAEVAGRPKPPEKPDGYKLELSEDFTKKFGELKDEKDSKVLGAWREAAHELGLSDQQFSGAIEKFYGAMEKAGLLDLGPDPDAEIEKLKPKSGDDRSRLAAAQKRINDAGAWVAGLEARGLDKAGVVMLAGLLENAQGIQAIEFLQKTFQTPGLVAGGQGGSAGGDTKESLEGLMRDPRYDSQNAAYDPRFRSDVDGRWRKLHGAA